MRLKGGNLKDAVENKIHSLIIGGKRIGVNMKYTGIVRRVDELGRIVLSKELRRTMNIKEGDPLEICTDEGSIILKKYINQCVCCGSGDSDRLVEKNGVLICPKCVEELRQEVLRQ